MEWELEIKDSEFVPQNVKPTEETVCYKIGGTYYVLPLAKVSTAHRTITAVQNIKAIREAVRRTLSARKS